MISDLQFGPARGRVRDVRFARRASIPLEAACLVANGIREALREIVAGIGEVVLGEPVPVDRDAWMALAGNAMLFATRGRQTDVVLVLPQRDARALVRAAFGEAETYADGACSSLEAEALERIAGRLSAACDPLCAERRGVTKTVRVDDIPPCVALFDIRVQAPIPLTIGVGIVRDLPDPGPSGRIAPASFGPIAVEARAQFATGTVDVATMARWRVGDVVRMNTKVGATGILKVGPQPIANGTCGVIAGRTAFVVHHAAGGMP